VNPIWTAGNAIAVVTALVCTFYLRYERKGAATGWPWVSIAIIGVTAIISGLQFPFPELVPLFERNATELRSGEVWRLVTPMFVQPGGLGHCLLNGFLFLAFLPTCERLYGKGLILIYFAAGLLGQLLHYWWATELTGGSSTAIFGAVGAIFTYVLRNRGASLKAFVGLSTLGLLAAVMLAVTHDGHGAGMLIGAAIATRLPAAPWRSRVSPAVTLPLQPS
jgi:membrane associated rhomboid family serine protease